MSDSSKGWDLATADTWLKDRPDGSGDPETRRACEQIIAEARKHQVRRTAAKPPTNPGEKRP
jgi:hypothetical protein